MNPQACRRLFNGNREERKMKPEIDYTLYLCTDRRIMTTDKIEDSVELAIRGGCSVVQLREKKCPSKEFYEIAMSVKEVTDAYEIPLLINDRVDIALAVGADGVHLGQLAVKAMKSGADYLGVGDVFGTLTKSGTKHITLDELKEIRQAVQIPVVAIGGVNADNIALLKPAGVDGAAVISAVVGQKDITAAAEKLISNFREA